jgi:eukaryotic-like serine/threonine-protein kinase
LEQDGVIVFAPEIASGLFRVADSGGQPVSLTKVESTPAGSSHRWPRFLPDGRRFLYFARGKAPGIYVGSLDSGNSKLIVASESGADYSPDGYRLWCREGNLMAQAFDAQKLELRGRAKAIAEHLLFSATQSVAVFSVSQTGILVLQGGGVQSSNRLSWLDRTGKMAGNVIGEQSLIPHPRVSPDGQRIGVRIADVLGNNRDIWLYDVPRGLHTRFTFTQTSSDAVWSPDGARIAHVSG